MKKILFTVLTGALLIVGCAKKEGCTEPNAINYDTAAEENDGSCKYATTTDTTSNTGGGTNTSSGSTDTTNTGGINTGGGTDSTNTGGTGTSTAVYGNGATDVNGNTYTSVIIGSQEWMAENLNTTLYNDGSAITLTPDVYDWRDITVAAAYCFYDNDSTSYSKTYGALYNWYAVNTGQLCPVGWHVPKKDEWKVLENYITANGHTGKLSAALKATSGWEADGYSSSNAWNGTDNYGFRALPGGMRSHVSDFGGIGASGYGHGFWWSNDETDDYSANSFMLSYGNSNDTTQMSTLYKKTGVSIRCLKD